ncbi:MAG TPA: AgmX/PglI C-terminal domain-containing protein, partial [Polyangiales bacterium]|nr:AgmX/PglI C-terminal domain-containing protein [Polyangiales bacterium]
TNLRTQSGDAPGTHAGTGTLSSEDVSKVVVRGRQNLQRCYETALRGAQSEETLKLTVDIQVSPGGNVTSVHTSGKSLPGMDECITRTVKMWRFPTSGDGAQTQFPVVFQPGAG